MYFQHTLSLYLVTVLPHYTEVALNNNRYDEKSEAHDAQLVSSSMQKTRSSCQR